MLDWSAWNVQADPVTEAATAPGSGGDATGGFAKAVEMCNNNGHCRKFDAGTMCPSYRVTRDEQHLTRGRANTLRLALSGQLGEGAFTSDEMAATMDLCVGCKGCRRDCPTGVDMARMKIEFTAHYKRRHGWTLKDRLVAGLPRQVHRFGQFPGLAGLLNLRKHRWGPPGASPRRTLAGPVGAAQLAGMARRHLLAQRAAVPFASRDAALAAARAGQKVAVLFVDTFNGGFETENAHAAARVLHAAGYLLHQAQKAAATTAAGALRWQSARSTRRVLRCRR